MCDAAALLSRLAMIRHQTEMQENAVSHSQGSCDEAAGHEAFACLSRCVAF